MVLYRKSKDDNKKRASLSWLSTLALKYLTSLICMAQNKVHASQVMATQTPPHASHRACPALGLSTKSVYINFRQRAIAYITALKDGVLSN